jgi:uncharacterized protein YfaS (alpha-2-macroglobulin family)
VTYPNVLVMGYLRQTGQLTPETQARLETALAQGYQKLLSFENPGGGFGWYRDHQVEPTLSAYALMILTDLSRVHPVDPKVIERTAQAIYRAQSPDGSFGDARTTAYVAWALLESGTDDARIASAVRWLDANWRTGDGYLTALCANVLVAAKSPAARECVVELTRLARVDSDAASWDAQQTAMYGRGPAGSVEATALAAIALARAKRPELLDRALSGLVRAKDPHGGWHSTQATVLSIKALLAASAVGRRPEETGVSVRLNGVTIPFDRITSKNWEVQQQRSLTHLLKPGANAIELVADSDAALGFQIGARYYLPWSEPAPSDVSIETSFSRSELRLDEAVECAARVSYRGPDTFMLIADVGLPSGFSPDADSLDALQRSGRIDKYTVTGRSVTIYLGKVRRGQTFDLRFGLRPRFVVTTQPPPSRVYEYYNPQNEGLSAPGRLVVRE